MINYSSAILSTCGLYRYRLERAMNGGGLMATPPKILAVIMVNPSTADATENDATIRKVCGFAQRNSFTRVIVGNVFAYRAKDVKELRTVGDPLGSENAKHLASIMNDADALLFAWGPLAKLPPNLRDHWRRVDRLARMGGKNPLCLGVAQDGHPRHPLMLPYNQPLTPWTAP